MMNMPGGGLIGLVGAAIVVAVAAAAPAVLNPSPGVASPLQAADPRAAPRCIDPDRIQRREAANPSTLRLVMNDGTIYHNKLTTVCPGLERLNRMDALSLEPTGGSQLCNGDRIRVFDPYTVRTTGLRSFPLCRLGKFVKVGEEKRSDRK